MKVYHTLALLTLLVMASCGGMEREFAHQLTLEKKSLNCELEHLGARNDSLWDELGQYLDKNLPTDIPPVQRNNMLTIRNARLIAEYHAFNELDTMIRQKVREAGDISKGFADDMKSVKEKADQVEQTLNAVLQKIEKRSEEEYQNLKQELQKIEADPCNL